MAVQDDIQQVISNAGLQALGIASPMLSVHWTDNHESGAVTESAQPLTVSCTNEWLAPVAGFLSVGAGWEKIILPSGDHITAGSVILRVFPQVYLRLQRLYATIIEGKTADTHIPDRPVPYYFVYTNNTNVGGGPEGGKIFAGQSVSLHGDLTIHDEHGFPIDPVSVANIFDQLVDTHQTLESKELLATSPTPQANRQLKHIGDLGSGNTLLHVTDMFNVPFDNNTPDITNLNVISAAHGVFSVTNTSNAILRNNTSDNKILFGSAISGTLGTSFTIPTPALTLRRDFLRLFVVKDFHELLIGTRDSGDAADSIEPRPQVRDNENISFVFNGNSSMGVASEILTNNTTKNVVVSPTINTDFTLPSDGSIANSQWPNFPTGIPVNSDTINSSIEADFNPTAHFIDGSEADIVLILSGLSPGQAVRVYNREFLAGAREGRGDGSGAVVTDASGKVALRLVDPLGLVQLGLPTSLPTTPNLHTDVIVVNSNNQARVFGNVTCIVGAKAALSAEETNLLSAETNQFNTAQFKGISHSGINGLSTVIVPLTGSTLDMILALSSEGDPRDAPRMPTMARSETIVAGSNSGTWNALLSGMWLRKDSRNSLHRLGSPGSHGGKDFQNLAITSTGGRISYDIARMGLKHAKNIAERLIELAGNDWNIPSAASGNSIVVSVLQTIAPKCETPEFSLVTLNFPATFSDFVDSINLGNLIDPMPDPLKTQLQNALNSLKTNANADRLYEEMKWEYSASKHGRRDTFWAVKSIIPKARQLIYIEGSFFGKTDYDTETNDFIEIIKNQLTAHPNLKLIIALTKEPIYGKGYETFKAREIVKRKELIDNLKTHAPDRVLAYHPIGFPGRPLHLNTNVIIVDDIWALIGSSSFRRRGFTFDGSVDIVCFDKNLSNGRGASMQNLRKGLMQVHLNQNNTVSGAFPDANLVRLNNMHSAFSTLKEILVNGGSGLIEEIWDGKIPGRSEVNSSAYPTDDIADPDGRDFDVFAGTLLSFLNGLSTAPPP